jgi:hypothetical protein
MTRLDSRRMAPWSEELPKHQLLVVDWTKFTARRCEKHRQQDAYIRSPSSFIGLPCPPLPFESISAERWRSESFAVVRHRSKNRLNKPDT